MVRYSALKGLFEVEKTIGCGGFAKVKLATHVATGEKVAIKIMEKSMLGDDLPRVKMELKALKSLNHEHICKLYQVIETETHFFLIIEYCSGGELFDHIVEKNRLTESESRMFFRQIVSAVAHLHSLGYAHRDLKPENVLLDKHQNLKLIDFGLCARPEGGVENPLFTSCGSPTYAAPELVMGKQYLGPEVDVWAMGVLLYALLVGSLPFDDLQIDSLYRKIMSGRYEEPSFLSRESRKLIRSMLQVDPEKRVTVTELLSHPWLTMGILDPVIVQTESCKLYDKECVNAMARHYQVEHEVMWKYLTKWKYDYHTSTYFLLLSRKKRGSALKLSNAHKLPLRERNKNEKQTNLEVPEIKPAIGTPKSKIPTVQVITPKKCDMILAPMPLTPKSQDLKPLPSTPKQQQDPHHTPGTPVGQFLEPRRPASAIRKPMKRMRSPTLDGDGSPVPAKKATPGKSTPLRTPDRCPRTPKNDSNSNPGSARRMLCSIERSLHKVRDVLTPKKPTYAGGNPLNPVQLTNKNMSNVSTTQCKDPEYVITKLSKALESKGIVCNRKGYRIRGKFEPSQRFGGCSFELEICLLPSLTPAPPTSQNNNQKQESDLATPTKAYCLNRQEKPYVGIRRKRLKGDSWCYKRVCEQVLALTATEFKDTKESAV